MGIQWDITWYNQYWGSVKMADLSPSNYDIFFRGKWGSAIETIKCLGCFGFSSDNSKPFERRFNWLVVDLPLWKIWVRPLGWLFPIYGQIKNVPNHQPVFVGVMNLWFLAKNHMRFFLKIRAPLFTIGCHIKIANNLDDTYRGPFFWKHLIDD